MKDLSKEKELRQRIFEMADACDKKKWLRVKRTFFVLSGVIYLMALMYGGISDIKDCLWLLLIAPFAAGFVMFISYGVLFYIIDGAMKDEKDIAKKIGELEAIKLSKYNACEDEKIKTYLKPLNNLLELIIDEYRDLELDEDFDNEVEENEKIKNQLENLKSSLKLIDNEYNFLKLNKVFDDEVEEQ